MAKGRKTGGRQAGTPNKATQVWKKFVVGLCGDAEVQAKAKQSILEGRTELLFKAAEHAFGKPKETVELHGRLQMIQWPDDEDVAEE